MPKRSRRLRGLLRAAPFLVLAVLLSGCQDNPSCVFTTGCTGGTGGPGSGSGATLPSDGQTILSGAPLLNETFPTGVVASTTPIALVFSESMAPETAQGKIELVPLDISGFPLGAVPVSQSLVADGCVLVLLPAVPLLPAAYIVQVAGGATITDLTGQKLAISGGVQLTSFEVDVSDPVSPSVVATFPEAGSPASSTTTQIVTLFDREIDATTITDLSFDVQVDGVPPAFDPLPTPLTITAGFIPIVDTRVFMYRSVDGDGEPVSLGTDGAVALTLSPGGSEIEALDGEFVPETIVHFVTQPIDAPIFAAILSTPSDGIGIANLTAGDPEELAIQVDFAGLAVSDEVVATLFGDSLDEDPVLIALARTKSAGGVDPVTAVSFSLAELDVASSPGVARFGDGTLSFAFAARRGSDTTAVHVLDVDVTAGGIQDPLLDTQAPQVTELLSPDGAGLAGFRSDQRDLVLAGRADEPIRSAEVVTPLGDNGVLAQVVGSDAGGLFVTAPVPLGLIDDGGPVNFDLTVYDAALNPSVTTSGVFSQHGAVGGTTVFTPGDPITVEVVDAVTLAPIEFARVFTHVDVGDGVSFPLLDSDTTDALGLASVASALTPAGGTILTVEADGHGLFTFHGLTTARISVPLGPTGPSLAAVAGTVTTSDPLVNLTLSLLQRKFDDPRRLPGTLPTFDGGDCLQDPFGGTPLACPFGPEPIFADRLGALSLTAGNFLLSEATFSASSLIQVFDLQIPRPPTEFGMADVSTMDVPFLLSDPSIDSSEIPLEVDPTVFSAGLMTGLDLSDLVGDPEMTGDPIVAVEALIPGVAGTTTVGLGLAFDLGVGIWNVRAAYPGAVGPSGFFGSAGAVDPDLLLRVEVRDGAGNRSGQRPRLSRLDSLPVPFTLFGPGVAEVTSPPPLGSAGGRTFSVAFGDVLFDISSEPGLYVVTLIDSIGRVWTLVRPDPPDGTPASVHVPDIAGGGGVPLSDGLLVCTVDAFSWPGLDLDAFLLSDIAREHDLFSLSGPITFTQP